MLSQRSFHIGDWVWLKLQPYRQSSVQTRMNQKLAHKYFGPFRVEDIIGHVAYKLTFLSSVKIHNVFHVSQLKPFRGLLPSSPHIPSCVHGTAADQVLQPVAILDRRVVQRHNVAAVQYLIQWADQRASEATWVFATAFEAQFPEFPLRSSLL